MFKKESLRKREEGRERKIINHFIFFYLLNTIHKGGFSLSTSPPLSMANKLVTPLGINDVFITEDCLVAQGGIKWIRKVADTLVFELTKLLMKSTSYPIRGVLPLLAPSGRSSSWCQPKRTLLLFNEARPRTNAGGMTAQGGGQSLESRSIYLTRSQPQVDRGDFSPLRCNRNAERHLKRR